MRRTETVDVLLEIRDLREDLTVARAEQVKTLRKLRAVVEEPLNRATVFGNHYSSLYLTPDDVLRDMDEMRALYYVVIPGSKNRAKPDRLISEYADRAALVRNLFSRLAALEEAAHQTHIDVSALPEEY